MAAPFPGFVVVSVPAGFASSSTPSTSGLLAAITEAHGRLLETLIGRPTTKVHQNFGTTDTSLFVETTLAYPDVGSVWAGEYLVAYTSKTAGSFEGCTSRARSKILAAGSPVTLHLPSAPPG